MRGIADDGVTKQVLINQPAWGPATKLMTVWARSQIFTWQLGGGQGHDARLGFANIRPSPSLMCDSLPTKSYFYDTSG